MRGRTSINQALTIIGLVAIVNFDAASLSPAVRAENNDESRQGLPTRRVGGGSRSNSCVEGEFSLTSLVPENLRVMTTANFPTFFVYLPAVNESKSLEFVLRDSNDQLVYDTVLPTTGKAGVISFSLPSQEATPLALNQDYHWYFSLICEPQNRAKDIVIEGLIRRIEPEPTFVRQLNELDPLEQVDLYQRANLWYEALSILARLRDSPDHTLAATTKWAELLEAVALSDIAQEPIIESYTGNVPSRQEDMPNNPSQN